MSPPLLLVSACVVCSLAPCRYARCRAPLCLGAGSEVAPSMARRGCERIGGLLLGRPCFWQGVGSRWPPRRRCRGGGHPVRSPWGSRRTGRVVGRCSGIRTQKPLRVHPFEGCAFPCFAKHRCSPCLLVKGTDCAGDVQRVAVVILTGLCVFCFSVLMGRSNTLTSPSGHVPVLCGCRVASVGTCYPTYLPRALCSPTPVAGRRP